MGLTRKQYDLLLFIDSEVREKGIPPSYDDMATAMDLKSKSGVVRLVYGLEERGYIHRIKQRARSIQVLRLPENIEDRIRPAAGRGVNYGRTRPALLPPQLAQGGVRVPVVGRLAAGTPVEALQRQIADTVVPESMLGRGDHYAVEIIGDSMINAGVLDGDIAIIRETDTALTGEIALCVIDDHEATLKRLRLRGDHIALEAANPAYCTHVYGRDRVRIQGKLVGLQRRYA